MILPIWAQKTPKPKIDRRLRDTSVKYIFPLENQPRRHVIGLNIFGLFARNAHLFYEWKILSRLSVRQQAMAGRVRQPADDPSLPFRVRTLILGYGIEAIGYPWGKAPRGPWLSLGGTYRWYAAEVPYQAPLPGGQSEVRYAQHKMHLWSAMGLVGFQFIAGNWFVVAPYAGAAYNRSNTVTLVALDPELAEGVRLPGTAPWTIRGGIILGLAFK
ncbi:MAG: hypothetical protein N2110_01435 [Flavobacteriales bacterium]|nr:hypothetical protein [Flavobacteriales bacterium]